MYAGLLWNLAFFILIPFLLRQVSNVSAVRRQRCMQTPGLLSLPWTAWLLPKIARQGQKGAMHYSWSCPLHPRVTHAKVKRRTALSHARPSTMPPCVFVSSNSLALNWYSKESCERCYQLQGDLLEAVALIAVSVEGWMWPNRFIKSHDGGEEQSCLCCLQ